MGGMANLMAWLKFKTGVDKHPYFGYPSHNDGLNPTGLFVYFLFCFHGELSVSSVPVSF
jgi:hypothetical protein